MCRTLFLAMALVASSFVMMGDEAHADSKGHHKCEQIPDYRDAAVGRARNEARALFIECSKNESQKSLRKFLEMRQLRAVVYAVETENWSGASKLIDDLIAYTVNMSCEKEYEKTIKIYNFRQKRGELEKDVLPPQTCKQGEIDYFKSSRITYKLAMTYAAAIVILTDGEVPVAELAYKHGLSPEQMRQKRLAWAHMVLSGPYGKLTHTRVASVISKLGQKKLTLAKALESLASLEKEDKFLFGAEFKAYAKLLAQAGQDQKAQALLKRANAIIEQQRVRGAKEDADRRAKIKAAPRVRVKEEQKPRPNYFRLRTL